MGEFYNYYLNIYEHILFVCIQTKNILMDAAYAEQENIFIHY